MTELNQSELDALSTQEMLPLETGVVTKFSLDEETRKKDSDAFEKIRMESSKQQLDSCMKSKDLGVW